MESILALALEYTLKYWLKSFSRDQFKLQGRTAQLSNLGKFGDSFVWFCDQFDLIRVHFEFASEFDRYKRRCCAFEHGIASGTECSHGQSRKTGNSGW